MCPACRSCAVPGKLGTCSPTGDGTVCGQALCDGQDRYRPPSTCSNGSCVQGTRVECAPYGCEVASGCKTGCATNTDCARMHVCAVSPDGGANACVSSGAMP
jgi:hypothetical protein